MYMYIYIYMYMYIYIYMVGVFNPAEKYEVVSWNDEIPNWMESQKNPWFQTTNQMM